MQTTRPASIAALLLAASLLLSGCGSGGTEPTASPQSSGEPVFASEEEALAAAEDVYRAYTSMTDQILQEGGLQPERIEPFVSEDLLESEVAYFRDDVAARGAKQTGSVTITSITLQQYSDEDGLADIVFYACLDLSNVSHAPPPKTSTPEKMALEVSLQATKSAPLPVVTNVEPWLSAQSC